jgi:hypothetical protein
VELCAFIQFVLAATHCNFKSLSAQGHEGNAIKEVVPQVAAIYLSQSLQTSNQAVGNW